MRQLLQLYALIASLLSLAAAVASLMLPSLYIELASMTFVLLYIAVIVGASSFIAPNGRDDEDAA